MDYIEIGAAVHMDRTTVSRHMRDVIAPQLERLMEKQQPKQKPKQQLAGA